MAVGTPYGKGAYGKGPYARYGTGRPYGIGAYGIGPYETWGGNTFDVAGATGVRFGVTASAAYTIQPDAVTGIVFSVSSIAPQLTMLPWATTQIAFSVWTHAAWTWDSYAPCISGDWAPAAPCETGLWTPPPDCSAGNWQPARLT